MSRYARQAMLPEVGPSGQARLRAARVLVVGAGGLGAPVLPYLAGAGVGAITIVDPDRVELSNLHRQTLFRTADLGLPKAVAAQATLAALNPEITLRAEVRALDPASADALLSGQDLVLDCADSFAASYVASDACRDRGLPLISASALGLSGYAGGFCGGAPSLRAVFPDLPDRGATCASAGVLGPVVGVIGAVQAQMALSVLLGLAPSSLGQMVTFDAATWRMSGFRFDTAPEPAAGLRFVAPSQIRVEDLAVDLRQPEEGPLVVPWALRIAPQDIDADRLGLAPGQRLVLCCQSGLRAWRAGRALQDRLSNEIVLAALAEEIPR
ncbi:ThiF family adenylyltransferase [Plastorhodobacter daqingensis]|uniref:ThiF family adenylyltransferase n=1 Tax=Plastorhodobacter daqingensis TaxID=1387281 RepID=A0ABW2UNY6_9RHOB